MKCGEVWGRFLGGLGGVPGRCSLEVLGRCLEEKCVKASTVSGRKKREKPKKNVEKQAQEL